VVSPRDGLSARKPSMPPDAPPAYLGASGRGVCPERASKSRLDTTDRASNSAQVLLTGVVATFL
jgi:hypothetical protein